MREVTHHVHFSVDGGFLTDLVRTLWADDQQPEKAMRVLESSFPPMTYEQRLSVVCGSRRLEGVNDMELVEDNATHTKMGNALTLESVMAKLRADQERGLDALQMHAGITTFVSSEYGLVEIPVRRLDDYKMNHIKLDDIIYRCVSREEALRSPQADAAREALGLEMREIVEASGPPPLPTEAKAKITQDIGWLAPDSKFYPCEYAQHNEMARALGHEDERPLQALGWVKLTRGVQIEGDKPASQAQLDKLFDYFNELPWWARE